MAVSTRTATTFKDRTLQHIAVNHRTRESRLTNCLRTGHSDV
jgi:hypothetical protein